MILLAGEVMVLLGVEGVLLLLIMLAAWHAGRILPAWDFTASTHAQYEREKQAALVGLLISAVLVFKFLLLPYFTFTVDRLEALIPGAMCGVGVLGANGYGVPLLSLRVVTVFAGVCWWLLRQEDLRATDHPHMRKLLVFALVLAALALSEALLTVLYFTNISTMTPVLCCSRVFGVAGETSGPALGLPDSLLLTLFGLLFVLTALTGWFRYRFLSFLTAMAFLVVGYSTVVQFFGTYVYELPTHMCPVCMLQPAYHGIGYWIWGTLLAGSFCAGASWVLERLGSGVPRHLERWGVALQTAFVLTCVLLVVVYYLRHGVFLD